MTYLGFIGLIREEPSYGWLLLIHIALLVLAILLVVYTRRIGSAMEKVNYSHFVVRLLKEQFRHGEITEEQYGHAMRELEEEARRHLSLKSRKKE